MSANIYVSLSEKGRQLVLEGPLDLFQQFLNAIGCHTMPADKNSIATITKNNQPILETKDRDKPRAEA
jgi:hypothetical protein